MRKKKERSEIETLVLKQETCREDIAKSLEKYLDADPVIATAVAESCITKYYGFELSRRERFTAAVYRSLERASKTLKKWRWLFAGAASIALFLFFIVLIVFGIWGLVGLLPETRVEISENVRFHHTAWYESQSCITDGVCIRDELVDAANRDLDELSEGEQVELGDYKVRKNNRRLVFTK